VKLYRPVIELEWWLNRWLNRARITDRSTNTDFSFNSAESESFLSSMAEQLGINQSALQKHLNHLKDAGWLERVGGTRGYWAIKKEFGGVV
jgi:ATP-dependent DNA helicase RecG